MKAVKKLIQIICSAIGIFMTLMCVYYVIYEPQTLDKFVAVVTLALSFVISFWLNGCIKWSEESEDNNDESTL